MSEPNCTNPSEHSDWHVADLALCHFPGKWKAAKDHASILHATYSHAWWMSARQYYLELGGEYVDQLPRRAQPPITEGK